MADFATTALQSGGSPEGLAKGIIADPIGSNPIVSFGKNVFGALGLDSAGAKRKKNQNKVEKLAADARAALASNNYKALLAVRERINKLGSDNKSGFSAKQKAKATIYHAPIRKAMAAIEAGQTNGGDARALAAARVISSMPDSPTPIGDRPSLPTVRPYLRAVSYDASGGGGGDSGEPSRDPAAIGILDVGGGKEFGLKLSMAELALVAAAVVAAIALTKGSK